MQTIYVLPDRLQNRFFFCILNTLQGMLADINYCAKGATYTYGLNTTPNA